ncbi:MAG: recombinase family protein [Oscillospiraceae bacterium]|nr:recombinase family protein [Oscillospiraceae bacterium]
MGRRKREPMSEGKKNIIAGLLEEYDIKTAKDIEDALKDLLGGTIQEIEIIFPDYDIRYIAINDNVDTLKSENELMAFKNIFNDWYARDTSKKIRAVFKAKGQSGKPLSIPCYGYKHSEMDKHLWVIDEEPAEVVRKIFRLCIEGYGPTQIARILTEEGIPTPTAYALSQGRDNGHKNAKLHRWGSETISGILEKPEYCGHTVNFRTHVKSYKNKKRVDNPKEDWLIFENTHEAIVTQQEFDLVQELRKNKRRPQKHEEVNPFSGMVYCADCGKKMYLCRATSLTSDQEHMKCATYAKDKDSCTAHFIRTIVLKEIVLSELNKLLVNVRENEDEFVQAAMDNSVQKQSSELSKAKKKLKQAEKRIAELDKLFTRLYEDNVSGKISDERFAVMSAGYEDEQKKLMTTVSELTAYIDTAEQKSADVTAFIKVVRKYEHITVLTPEIMHELIEKIVIHAPDKSSGHRTQQIDIYYRFDVAVSTAIADSRKYDKKRKAA